MNHFTGGMAVHTLLHLVRHLDCQVACRHWLLLIGSCFVPCCQLLPGQALPEGPYLNSAVHQTASETASEPTQGKLLPEVFPLMLLLPGWRCYEVPIGDPSPWCSVPEPAAEATLPDLRACQAAA